jgi:C4-dicarboxylate transporter DctM subunit
VVALFAGFFILIIIGLPIAVAMGVTVCGYFLLNDVPMALYIQQLAAGAGSFPLLAVPFFMFAGVVLGRGGAAQRLIDFANSLVGFLWGGLAQVSIVGSMFFAGVSGSSVADAAGIGSILIPEMKRKGYGTGFSVAINAVSSTIGIIIPPSIPMVVYAWMAEESVGKMFLAGVVPGVLFGLVQIVVAYVTAKQNDYPREPVPTIGGIVQGFKDSILSLLLPVLVLGGIVAGVVTPTEAGVLAVVYGIFLGLVVYRDMTLNELPEVLLETIESTAAIMFVLGAASAFSWILAYEQVPDRLVAWFAQSGAGRVWFLLFVNVVCLFLGTFIGGTSAALILVTPIFLPVAKSLGIDPIHLGIVLIANLAIGLFTPPVGTTLFISCHIGEMSIWDGFKACVPFLIPMLGVLLLITYVPSIPMFLPGLL